MAGRGGGGLSGGECPEVREFLLCVWNSRDLPTPAGLPDLNLLLYTGSSKGWLTPVGDTGGDGKLLFVDIGTLCTLS